MDNLKLYRKVGLLFFFFLMITKNGKGQERVSNKSDSIKLYERIENFSERRKITRCLYRLIFRPVICEKATSEPVVKAAVPPVYYFPYEGKGIRSIRIRTMDPFGYDSRDTALVPENFLQKAGNSIHIKSLPASIRNLLLIKKYDTFDSLRVRESERLIRSQSFVRDVVLIPIAVNNS